VAVSFLLLFLMCFRESGLKSNNEKELLFIGVHNLICQWNQLKFKNAGISHSLNK